MVLKKHDRFWNDWVRYKILRESDHYWSAREQSARGRSIIGQAVKISARTSPFSSFELMMFTIPSHERRVFRVSFTVEPL